MSTANRTPDCRVLVATTAIAVGVCLAVADARQPASQQATFAARVEAVRIDALVTENGRPVAGLAAGEFDVRDNGVRQNVDLLSFDRVPVTVVFAFDVSQSMTGPRLADLRAAARTVLGGLRAGDEAGLVTFSAAVTRPCEVTADRERVTSALEELTTGGGTSLVDGVFAAMTLDRAGSGRALVIVFSDGLDISSWLRPDTVLDAAKRSNAVVYSVAAGEKRVLDSRRFLRDLADASGGSVFDVASTRDLDGTFKQVLAEFRQRYVLSYVPRGVSKDGWHKVEVRLPGRRGATVKARPGYFADGR